MKRCLKGIVAPLIALFSLLFVWTFLLPKPVSVHAETASTAAYDFTIKSFNTEMVLASNRKIQVTERIVCSFSGYDSHGIIRDFPLDSGVRYRNIKATCEDSSDFSPYIQFDDVDFISLYLRGKGQVSGQTRTYVIRYTMVVPALEEGYLPIDVLGYGWQTSIGEFSAKITIPEGLLETKLYSGYHGATQNLLGVEETREGNVISLSAESISFNRGITLDLQFSEGVLSAPFDASILYAFGLGILLVGLAFILRMRFCRQPIITATVNFDAPEEMDPLLMGKLIDNKVDSEDLGALVFYLADKGYLTIDMSESEKKPTLVKRKHLDPNEPNYIQTFFSGLFEKGDSVRIKDLNEKFYKTAESTKGGAELQAGETYSYFGKAFLGIFAALTLLLLGGFGVFYHIANVFSNYFYWAAGVACIVSFAIAAFGSAIARQREFKWKKSKRIVTIVSSFVLALLPTLLFYIVRSPVFGLFTGFILVCAAAAAGSIAGGSLVRTEEYSKKLGQILGFKQFILYTERDKVEFMLKENPELYYHILPYAQVLGVTDAWTDKFKGLNMQPPTYVRGYSYDLFDVLIFHSMFHSMSGNMARSFVSRPSSSGGGFNHGGGFGGGFGGGGFGGGGGRGC